MESNTNGRLRRAHFRVFSILVPVAAGVLAFAAAIRVADAAPTPAKGWAVSEFATGFATSNNVGPIGIAFDTKGKVYISDSTDGFIYRFPRSGVPAGGWKVASSFRLNSTPYTSIPPLSAIAWGLAFGKDGRFYINRPTNTSGETDEINSLDGKILRVVQSGGLPCPSQLSTDPLSGDLMTDSTCGINGPLYRIRNPASTKPTVAAYSSSLATPDGFDFGRDGTIYIASGYNSVYIINGTNKTTAGKTTLLTGVSPGTDGIGIAADGSFLALNNNNGFMQEVTLPALTTSNIFSSGTRGDIAAVGPDGCLYADESTDVVKVTRADGTCPFLPTNPTATPTRTPLRATPTHTRAVTRTPRRTPARTPSRTPSHTPTRTHTRTPTRTATRKPTPTPTRKPTATATAAPIIADLKANWSDSNNPNKSNPKGAWEYRQGTTNLPLISNWNGAGTVGFTMIQPAWAPSDTFGNFLPAFFKARSLPTNMDWQVGDVVVHTVDASNGNQGKGIANVLFTDASFSATVAITGSVWDAAHDTSRPQDWALLVNGTQVASGKMNGAVARAAPQTFKVTGVSLAPGKTVELEVFRDSSGAANCNGGPCGYFVGATLSIR